MQTIVLLVENPIYFYSVDIIILLDSTFNDCRRVYVQSARKILLPFFLPWLRAANNRRRRRVKPKFYISPLASAY